MEDDRYTRITLRLPKDLHERLDSSSDAKSRSLNAEIVDRLEESFASGPDLALALAESQHRAVEQSLELDMVRRELGGILKLTKALRAGIAKFGVELPPDFVNAADVIMKSAQEIALTWDDKDVVRERKAQLEAASAILAEARMRFLEAKGAKGVRKAKV